MNPECLRDCSSTELFTTQKRIAEILKTRHGRSKHSGSVALALSRSTSRCSNTSRRSRKSGEYNFSTAKSNTKRSRSLIDLRDGFSATSTCVGNINKKYQTTYRGHSVNFGDFGESQARAIVDDNSDEDDDVTEKTLSLSTSLSNVTYCKAQDSEIRSKQYQKLTSAVKHLYLVLDNVCMSTVSPVTQQSQSRCRLLERKQIPRFYEKDSILKLARIVDTLSKNVQEKVSHFLSIRKKEKTRLEESRNNNKILKQRLSNSLTIQKNLEGELKELNKEKNWLETENKNLAIKMVPFLNESGTQLKSRNESNGRAKTAGSSFYQNLLDDDKGNNNRLAMTSESCRSCKNANLAQLSRSYRSSRRSSFADLSTRCCCSNDENEPLVVSRSVSDSNLTSESVKEDISRAEHFSLSKYQGKMKSRDDLDKIASYVRWKHQDFERMHGNLHKKFEELQELKQTIGVISQEKTEILADLEDLVDSYQELERERDNYESILKMILKEKNSSESNIRELLDSLLVHLNNQALNSYQQRSFQRECPACLGADQSQRHECSKSRSFLESAVHVVQEQNIAVREELARVRESLQNATGQNTVLQTNNEALTAKVNDLQRRIESKESEVGNKEKEQKEKIENLDKLYNTVRTAKEELEVKLQEKEREIANLNLKNVSDVSDKALKDQAERIVELKEANVKLEKDIARFRQSNEKLTHMVKQLKAEFRDQKGKLSDQIKNTSSELQKSKEQCNWLQSQVDNFKLQIIDAHERIKLQEKDKAILAHKVLAAEEERKTLDRNIQEIRTIMEADKLYQHALTDRNEQLQSEVNRLRTEKLNVNTPMDADISSKGCAVKTNKDGDGTGEQKRNNSIVRTVVKTVKAKSNPAKSEVTQRPASAKSASCRTHHHCAVRPSTVMAPTCSSEQRSAAARRLANSLSNSPRRQCLFKANEAASSGHQDSTQTPSKCEHQSSTANSMRGPISNNLLCTSEILVPPSGTYGDITPLSRKHRHHHYISRKNCTDVPKATVSLHNNSAAISNRAR